MRIEEIVANAASIYWASSIGSSASFSSDSESIEVASRRSSRRSKTGFMAETTTPSQIDISRTILVLPSTPRMCLYPPWMSTRSNVYMLVDTILIQKKVSKIVGGKLVGSNQIVIVILPELSCSKYPVALMTWM